MKTHKTPAETLADLSTRAAERWASLRQKTLVAVGTATCGRAAGALEVARAFREEIDRLGVDAAVIEVGCIGHCYAEPMAFIFKPGFPGICYGYLNEGLASRLVQDFLVDGDPCVEFALAADEPNDFIPTFQDFPRGVVEKKVVMEHCGLIDPEDIDHYLAVGGYGGLARALAMDPGMVTGEILSSGLRGRGGAGFPTGQKWSLCSGAAEKTRYVICNADEGDPGAFMDRTILESNPHLVVEGLATAAYAVGAGKGYFYIRAEYPLAVERVKKALQQAYEYGILGESVLGTGFSLEIEVFQGSGAFVCGEETALMASIEGEPGLPRHRPPFPSEAGLFGKPTVIDNVKTLSYVPYIIKNGADWFKGTGTAGSPGTAIFALAGKLVNTGLAEVPMGTTLREIIYDVGSGIAGNNKFKAVQIGGPSGGCLPEETLDTPIDFDSLTKAGAMMGSGGMVVLDENDCMVEMARFFLDFIQKESCGKCTFCRLGTKHMLNILERITRGNGRPEDIDLLLELAGDIRAGSLCSLGKTAPNPVLSTLKFFRHEYDAHIHEKRCPSLMCKDLIAYYILPHKCERSCDACVGSCPVEAIYSNEDRIKVINQEKCVKCNSCLAACPPQYKAVIKVSPPDQVAVKEKEKNEH
ncbi:MAG: NADH-quinone oxidoreductase subunit NuoF [Peptococcaceae bacterium]|nr:NADH-quinone oxidoreductase subunit NuoF [Peptococcaceae bacterium]